MHALQKSSKRATPKNISTILCHKGSVCR